MIRFILFICLYTAFIASANADSYTHIADIRQGDMRKLIIHPSPKPASNQTFYTIDDAPLTLDLWRGKYVLINFWATWCAPCRKEMPSLSELQTQNQGPSFEVITIATGRNSVAGMRDFFAQLSIDNLPLYRDPKQKLAGEMGVLGLPISIVLDRQGREIARLRGEADWASQNAKDIIDHLIALP